VKLGVISDTHNLLDPGVETAFAGVDHILHAGDVCRPTLIAELEAIAPVTVALGNNDTHPAWREFVLAELAGRRFLVEHIVDPHRPSQSFRARLQRLRPDVVVFGHTHRPFCQTLDGVLFLNPGSAGAPRFGLPRSVYLVDLADGRIDPRLVRLA
jgi:putative phosphoesterase